MRHLTQAEILHRVSSHPGPFDDGCLLSYGLNIGSGCRVLLRLNGTIISGDIVVGTMPLASRVPTSLEEVRVEQPYLPQLGRERAAAALEGLKAMGLDKYRRKTSCGDHSVYI